MIISAWKIQTKKPIENSTQKWAKNFEVLVNQFHCWLCGRKYMKPILLCPPWHIQWIVTCNMSHWSEEMILALAGQFKQYCWASIWTNLPFNCPFKLDSIWTHDLYDTGAVLLPSELWSHSVDHESMSFCWAHGFPWKDSMNGRNEMNWRNDPRTCWTIQAIVS